MDEFVSPLAIELNDDPPAFGLSPPVTGCVLEPACFDLSGLVLSRGSWYIFGTKRTISSGSGLFNAVHELLLRIFGTGRHIGFVVRKLTISRLNET